MSAPKPYGDVRYADPKNGKYPIDTEERVRAAWRYINEAKDAAKYTASELAAIKRRIISAWKSVIDKAGPPSAVKAAAADACPDCGAAAGEEHEPDCTATVQMSARMDPLRIIADNSPRGGVIQIPVARHATVTLAGTAGGGEGSIAVDDSMFEQIVENFEAQPQPVNAYFGHENSAPRKPDTPAIGVVTDIWVEGDTLWNEINLGPKAWDLIVVQKGFNGASIEAVENKTTPTGDVPGWGEYGLSITNKPALPVQYLAAGAGGDEQATVRLSAAWVSPEAKESGMDITLETLKADKVKLEAKIVDLEKGAAASKTKVAELEAKVAELEKRPPVEKLIALEAKIADLENRDKAREVKAIHAGAIAAGKPPAFFEGCDADPIKFLNDRFKGDLAAFQLSVNALPVVAKMSGGQGPGSGGSGSAAGSAKQRLIAEAKKIEASEKVSFNEALNKVRDRDPKLFAEGVSEYQIPEVTLA